MDKKDQTTSETQQSEADLPENASSDMLTLIPISSSNRGHRIGICSELYSHYMIMSDGDERGRRAFDVLDLETDKWVIVKFQGAVSSLNKSFSSICKKGKDEIVLYTNQPSSVLTFKDDDGFGIRIKDFQPKNEINVSTYSLHFFNDKFYLLSGTTKPSLISQHEVYSLDFTSLEWTKCEVTQNLPQELISLKTVLFDGKIYFFGYTYGKDGEKDSPEFYELDLKAENLEWKKVVYTGSAPSPRYACMVAENGKIYVFAGYMMNANHFYQELFEYDISSQIWREININCKFVAVQCYSGVLYKGTLFVAGKFLDKDNNLYHTAKIKIFDPQLEKEKQFKLQLENLSVDPQSSDILFKVHDQTFPAHKAVLSARCQFFKNMFENGMMENSNSEIVIQDIEPSSFKAMLDYIYTDKVEFTVNLAIDLLKLSDKWSFIALKSECEEFLTKQLTPDNFKEIAVLTKHVEAPSLEESIIDFVLKNVKATKDRESLLGLPQELYTNIIAKIIDIKFDN